MPWSILTDVAPVTLHNKIEVPPALIVEGLLLNSRMAGAVPDGRMEFGGGILNVMQPDKNIPENRMDTNILFIGLPPMLYKQ